MIWYIVEKSCENYGGALQSASDRLKDNIEIVEKAVNNTSWSLEYASERLQNDEELYIKTYKK